MPMRPSNRELSKVSYDLLMFFGAASPVGASERLGGTANAYGSIIFCDGAEITTSIISNSIPPWDGTAKPKVRAEY